MNNKTWFISLLIMGFTVLFATSCKKADENTNTASPAKGKNSLSATVDGASYVATSFTIMTSGGKLGISAMNGSKNLILWLPEDFTTGTHSLSIFGDYMAQYTSGGSNIFSSTSGTIVISEYVASNGKIKGTFNFEASDNSTTIEVKDGVFEVYK